MSYSDALRLMDLQIARLTNARTALIELIGPTRKTAPAKKKSTLSPAGRLSIQRAQRARWAKKKREARKAA